MRQTLRLAEWSALRNQLAVSRHLVDLRIWRLVRSDDAPLGESFGTGLPRIETDNALATA